MLVTKESIKELNRIKYGKPVSFTYRVKNETGTPLEINKLIVGCGSCTKATTNKTNLAPDEEIDINVVFTPGSTGPQKKHVTVRYNEDMILKLEFTADVYA